MSEIVQEGRVTAIDAGDEYIITHVESARVSELIAAYKIAADRGFTDIHTQYFDEDGDFDVIILRKGVSA